MAPDSDSEIRFSAYKIEQLVILSFARLAEPITMTSIFPYLYYMIKSFGVAPTQVSFWVGITAASFSFCQFFTGIFWGQMSDRYGRKPIILSGLIGTMLSTILFGFSTSLPMAIISRCLTGLLNGNVGVLRTAVAEMVPERPLQPKAFSIMPLVWTIGSILGPMIGGALADPLESHPQWFDEGSRPAFFAKFPFALPNLVASSFFLIGIPLGYLFLDETLESKRGKRDFGREVGDRIIAVFSGQKGRHVKTSRDDVSEDECLIPNSPIDEEVRLRKIVKSQARPPLVAALTFQSSLCIISYGLLALHAVTADQLLPVLMSFPPRSPADQKLPLNFAGGFGLSSAAVGKFFSATGIVGMVAQFLIFPPVAKKFGPLACFRIVAFVFPIIYLIVPFLVLAPKRYHDTVLYAAMFCKTLAAVFAFPCSIILLTNSSPSLRVLGTLNGISVAIAAIGRAIGPAAGGLAFTFGQRIGMLVIPWWGLAVLTVLSALPTLFMTEDVDVDVGAEDCSSDGDIEDDVSQFNADTQYGTAIKPAPQQRQL